MRARHTNDPIVVQCSFSGAGNGQQTCCFGRRCCRSALFEAVGGRWSQSWSRSDCRRGTNIGSVAWRSKMGQLLDW